jgi:hypothetical protein
MLHGGRLSVAAAATRLFRFVARGIASASSLPFMPPSFEVLHHLTSFAIKVVA